MTYPVVHRNKLHTVSASDNLLWFEDPHQVGIREISLENVAKSTPTKRE